MIQFPLALPDVEVLKTELTAADHGVITVESTRDGTRCRREITEPHGHDRPLTLRPLPVLERSVYLEIRPKRYHCPYGSIILPPPSAVAGTSPTAPHPGVRTAGAAQPHPQSAEQGRPHAWAEEAGEGILDRQIVVPRKRRKSHIF
jgi:hypothetical protein